MDSIIATDIYSIIKEKESVASYLEDLLEVFDIIKTLDFIVNKEEKIWEYEVNEDYFFEWLYSKDIPELVDLKTEFAIQIEKASTIECDIYAEILTKMNFETESFYKFEEQVLLLGGNTELQDYSISTLSEFYAFLRKHLKKCPDKNVFIEKCPSVFPNLYFHTNVLPSLRSLNTNFTIIIKEIVEHLEGLNAYSMNHNQISQISNRDKCKEIEAFFGIECSPESDRGTANKMSFEFQTDTNIKKMKCEYHTKFKKFGIDKNKQDRIYFSFGDEDYQNGNIIIYHIGDHV